MKTCDDQELLKVLNDTSATEAHPNTVAHIDACERCQKRLVELAADGDSWSEATFALRDSDVFRNGEGNGDGNGEGANLLAPFHSDGSVIIAVDAELSADMPVQADRVSLDFLAKPSHPEMLGRVGRFDVERLIGAGGMGIVFKAFDSDLHRPIALKVLAPHLAHSGGARQRFAREAQSAAAVVHENVVPIHYVDTEGELPFLVMQYVGGESLQARIDRDGPLSADEVLQVGIQIARGLAAAHDQGLVHRDVKPGNILLESAVNRVLITDFGLARAADDASVTRSGIIAGTPHYMSPEQARGQAIDSRSDLFGLGGVLYFMCTGRPAFRADGAIAVLNKICSTEHRPVDQDNAQVPAALADLIDELLAKDPANRPENATSVATELAAQLKSFRSGSRRFRKPKRALRRRVGWLAAAATVLLAGTIGWGVVTGSRGDNQPVKYVDSPPMPSDYSDGRVNDFGGEPVFYPSPNAYAPPVANISRNQNPIGFAPQSSADAEFYSELNELQREIGRYESQYGPNQPSIAVPPAEDTWPLQINETESEIQRLEQRLRN